MFVANNKVPLTFGEKIILAHKSLKIWRPWLSEKLLMSLLISGIVKNSHYLAGIYFLFLKKPPRAKEVYKLGVLGHFSHWDIFCSMFLRTMFVVNCPNIPYISFVSKGIETFLFSNTRDIITYCFKYFQVYILVH